jgi:hypothetical protein
MIYSHVCIDPADIVIASEAFPVSPPALHLEWSAFDALAIFLDEPCIKRFQICNCIIVVPVLSHVLINRIFGAAM